MEKRLSQLKAEFLESVGRELETEGFKLKAAKDSFVRHRSGVSDIFQLVCKDGKPGWKVQPNVAIRLEQVEEIFHGTSGFELQYQKDTPMGASVGRLLSGSTQSVEFLLASDSDLAPTTEQALRIFRETASPYFERWGSLQAIDAELNDDPSKKTPHRSLAWFRCSTGIIVARLVGRADYEKLAEFYTEVMTQDNKGFYLTRFQNLLRSLESAEPGGGLAAGRSSN